MNQPAPLCRVNALPDLSGLPGLPLGEDGPVFREPWQAQAFGMALALHQRGLFSWQEWAQALSAQIYAAQALGDPDLGDTYYQHWLAALESLVSAKGASSPAELARYQQAWDHAADRTPHGHAIELRDDDFAD
jgi:nitrile hydratase accessory protein